MSGATFAQRWLRPEVRPTTTRRDATTTTTTRPRTDTLKNRSIDRSNAPTDARAHPASPTDRLTNDNARAHIQVYPIFAAIGGAVGLCTFFCTRQLITSPGFTAAKSKRMAGVRETPEDVEEGKKWRNHVVRRTLRSMYSDKGITPQIFGGLNGSYGGGQH